MKLSVVNFKCFASLELQFAQLTVLTGYNGSGKSTVIQALLALAQSFRRSPGAGFIDVDGSLVSLGNLSSLARAGGGTEVQFAVAEDEERGEWSLGPSRSELPGHVTTASSQQRFAETRLFKRLRDLSYLSLHRYSGQAFPAPSTGRALGDMGAMGEFGPYWHYHLGDTDVDQLRRHPKDERVNVRGQLNAYFDDLFPGAEATTDKLKDVDLWRLAFHIGRTDWVTPANIGYGLSYAFPILLSLLTVPTGGLVIVDSPEAHLHPRAQSRLGWMFGRLASAGLSLIVETHSDHFLNGVRLAVREGMVSPETVKVLFFSGASDSGHGIEELRLDKSGDISNWPKGFFDQAERDMARLLGFSE